MFTTSPKSSAELATALLTHYSFDLSGYTASELINRWQSEYPVKWLHLAVIEALYQGRYKGISVQQILVFWQRRGDVLYHFNMEFERLICSKFPESLTQIAAPVLPEIKTQIPGESASLDQPLIPHSLPATNSYRQTERANRQPMIAEAEEEPEEHLLVSSTVGAAVATQMRLDSQRQIQKSSSLPNSYQTTKLLPPSANHPPIGQFTPATSGESDSFTSKLKAMSGE
ncbi:hypothetical protein VB620_07655 [Nodularia harveyana UHCC-0300]|uniref:Uncharacterized protein n=1 Tax=Nodularia harveyana UHCC-0300 TaxID=2974287 RepID=A0ABU5UCF7_9CYAN|nr:hypothetical protein [Nodularia harveyana]MEA5581213.1 hypothetical protein [Nodularia harveyana UHCC-0300]